MTQMTDTRWWRRVLRSASQGRAGLSTEQKGLSLYLALSAAQQAYDAWEKNAEDTTVEAVKEAVIVAVSNAFSQPVESRQNPYEFAAGVIFNGGSAEDDADDEDTAEDADDDEDVLPPVPCEGCAGVWKHKPGCPLPGGMAQADDED